MVCAQGRGLGDGRQDSAMAAVSLPGLQRRDVGPRPGEARYLRRLRLPAPPRAGRAGSRTGQAALGAPAQPLRRVSHTHQDPLNEIEGEEVSGLKKVRTHDLKILALYDHIYRNRKWFDEQRRAEKNLRSA